MRGRVRTCKRCNQRVKPVVGSSSRAAAGGEGQDQREREREQRDAYAEVKDDGAMDEPAAPAFAFDVARCSECAQPLPAATLRAKSRGYTGFESGDGDGEAGSGSGSASASASTAPSAEATPRLAGSMAGPAPGSSTSGPASAAAVLDSLPAFDLNTSTSTGLSPRVIERLHAARFQQQQQPQSPGSGLLESKRRILDDVKSALPPVCAWSPVFAALWLLARFRSLQELDEMDLQDPSKAESVR